MSFEALEFKILERKTRLLVVILINLAKNGRAASQIARNFEGILLKLVQAYCRKMSFEALETKILERKTQF